MLGLADHWPCARQVTTHGATGTVSEARGSNCSCRAGKRAGQPWAWVLAQLGLSSKLWEGSLGRFWGSHGPCTSPEPSSSSCFTTKGSSSGSCRSQLHMYGEEIAVAGFGFPIPRDPTDPKLQEDGEGWLGFPCGGTPLVCTWRWQVRVPTMWGWHGAMAGTCCCQAPGQGLGLGHAGDAGQNMVPFHYGQEPP